MEIQPINGRTEDSGLRTEEGLRTERQRALSVPGPQSPVPSPQSSVLSPASSVEISEQALEMARAHEAVQKAPDVRADRVAEIKKQVEDGTYSVPPEVLAARLLGGS